MIASSKTIEEMCEAICADSLTFLTPEGMVDAIARPFDDEDGGLCTACFTNKYPTEIFSDTVLPHEKELLR